MCTCTLENLEIPGLVLKHHPGMTKTGAVDETKAYGNPTGTRDMTLRTIEQSDKTDGPKEPPDAAGRAAPPACLHHPRDRGCRRLCVAEGRRLAGGAARSIHSERGYP